MNEPRLERLLDLVQAQHIDRSLPAAARICLVCSDAINVDGAGLSLLTRTDHRSIAASDPVAAAIELAQIKTREGPCLDVHELRQPVMEPDLLSMSARRRWPSFAAEASDHGARAVFGFPLIIDREPIGALDLYSLQAAPLSDSDVNDALILADMAALAVHASEERGASGFSVATEPEDEWIHPAVVHHASGMTSMQLGISVEEALLRLRTHAFATDRALADVAADVVASRLRVEEWHRG